MPLHSSMHLSHSQQHAGAQSDSAGADVDLHRYIVHISLCTCPGKVLSRRKKSTGDDRHWALQQLRRRLGSLAYPLRSNAYRISVITLFHELPCMHVKSFFLCFMKMDLSVRALAVCWCTCAGRWQTCSPSTKLSDWKGTKHASCWHMRRPGAVVWKKVWTKCTNMPGTSTAASKIRYLCMPS